MNQTISYDAIIVGAGACGLMCAIQAGYVGKRVLILERNEKVGAKILISGGGRCNFTNLYTTSEQFVSENPRFAENAFAAWSIQDTVDFFKKIGIHGAEKTLGQLFPEKGNAKDIVAGFLSIIKKQSHTLLTSHLVTAINPLPQGGFEVKVESQLGKQSHFSAPSVVMASGGLPVAKLGASDFALKVARSFGIGVVQTAPALVPLTITGKHLEWFAALSGNSLFCEVKNKKASFKENILFTHWGLSGPAILQISSYWKAGEEIYLNLLPHHDFNDIIRIERAAGGKRMISQLLHDHFSKRVIEALGQFLPLDLKVASLSKADAKMIGDTLHRFTIKPAGDKGYDKAEVMRGGVDTNELNPHTLESLKIPGLYFGGECVDMTGWLGGYNFQWAWASGFIIARALPSSSIR
jgi:predicted Rossmann fold flavoprotein